MRFRRLSREFSSGSARLNLLWLLDGATAAEPYAETGLSGDPYANRLLLRLLPLSLGASGEVEAEEGCTANLFLGLNVVVCEDAKVETR